MLLKKMLGYGAIAGFVVGVAMSSMVIVGTGSASTQHSMVAGYLTMLVALSAVFVAIKRHRDLALGGVIRFWPAFGLGLGISVVASLIYVLCWETATAMAGYDFAAEYTRWMVAEKTAAGAPAAEIDELKRHMAEFAKDYADPLYRLPMVFSEIFPVGVLVSLVSAGLLRKPGFMPRQR